MNQIFFSSILLSILLNSCVSSKEGQAIRDDVFTMQTRITELEAALQQKEKSLRSDSESANQRVASTASRLDTLEQQIQRAKGDIDALKVGVSTGRLPGSEESSEGSVAQTIGDLVSRLEAVETNQTEILEAIEKSATKASGSKKASEKEKEPKDKGHKESVNPNSGAAKSIDDLNKAFAAKRFKFVIENAPKVIERSKGKAAKLSGQYLLAESLFATGKAKEAALQFSEFLERGPDRAKIPQAKIRIADCFRQMGDKATAKLFYEELVTKYAKSPQAGKAREHLTALSEGA